MAAPFQEMIPEESPPLRTERVYFKGSEGFTLAGKIDFPAGSPLCFGLFSHCFTCSMESHAARRICMALAKTGIAMLRFDFRGLGQSEGAFENTNFETNIQDILGAVEYLSTNYQEPKLLIGHSLGGASILFAAPLCPSVKAVVTLNTPCNPIHVSHHFEEHIEKILQEGEADVTLSGRSFKLRKHFLDSLTEKKTDEKLSQLKAALLVCHAPLDQTVKLENAAHIFMAAKHPKSFLSLDDSDHLITHKDHASYIAHVIRSWGEKYL